MAAMSSRRVVMLSLPRSGLQGMVWTLLWQGSAGSPREGLAEPVVLRVRMGVHTGVADERGGDYFGPTLNRTARLMALADGGGGPISAATERLLDAGGGPGWMVSELGEGGAEGRFPAGACLRADRRWSAATSSTVDQLDVPFGQPAATAHVVHRS